MFYSEEDVTPATQMAEQLLGPVGVIDIDAEHPNTCIATKKFGKIWYGDLVAMNLINVKTLRAFVGEDIYILFNENTFDYDRAIKVT
jgi:hypothetical protein